MQIELYNLGNQLTNRIPQEKINGALEYIKYNEGGLALETICDYLCEYNAQISGDEYKTITQLNEKLGLPIHRKTLCYIKEHLII